MLDSSVKGPDLFLRPNSYYQLQRHTARYPTEEAYHRIMRAMRKIHRLPDTTVSLEEYLEELEGWKSDGKLGQLTDNGREM